MTTETRQNEIKAALAEFDLTHVRFYAGRMAHTTIFIYDQEFTGRDGIEIAEMIVTDILRPLNLEVMSYGAGGFCYDSREKGIMITVRGSGLAEYRLVIDGEVVSEYATYEAAERAFDAAMDFSDGSRRAVVYSSDGRRMMWSDAEDAEYQASLDRIRSFSSFGRA